MYSNLFDNIDIFIIIMNYIINDIEIDINNLELKILFINNLIKKNKKYILKSNIPLFYSYRLFNLYPLYTNNRLF